MRQLVSRLGRGKTVVIATICSVLLSALVTYVVMSVMELHFGSLSTDFSKLRGVFVGVVVPLIVTPMIVWSLVELIFKIDALEAQMRHLATYDHLTGLLNRRAFLEQSSHWCLMAQRGEQRFCLVIIDLDDFKAVNDSFGHLAGDTVLKDFARQVNLGIRRSDLVGRLGGEEFAILFPNATHEVAMKMLDRLHDSIRKSVVQITGEELRYTVSMGFVHVDYASDLSISELLGKADEALYAAKNQGKNQTVDWNRLTVSC